MYERHFGSPFPGILQSLRASNGDIYGLQNNPNYVVRTRSISAEIAGQAIERFQKGKKLYDELRQDYGVYVPRHDLVLGMSIGGPAMYVVADRVYGWLISDRSNHPEEDKVNTLFSGLVSYYRDKYQSGRSISPRERKNTNFLTEIQYFQFMYGRKLDETENQIYLVDVDPVYSNMGNSGTDFEFARTLAELVSAMDDAKNQFSYADLSSSFAVMQKLLDSVDLNAGQQWVQDLADHLKDKKYEIGPNHKFAAHL